jgi:hypothetical protein
VIKVDKDIPIPPGPLRRGHAIYPWREMQIGDSFLYPAGTKRKTAQSTAYCMGKKLGLTFGLRETPEGLRCWRIL